MKRLILTIMTIQILAGTSIAGDQFYTTECGNAERVIVEAAAKMEEAKRIDEDKEIQAEIERIRIESEARKAAKKLAAHEAIEATKKLTVKEYNKLSGFKILQTIIEYKKEYTDINCKEECTARIDRFIYLSRWKCDEDDLTSFVMQNICARVYNF